MRKVLAKYKLGDLLIEICGYSDRPKEGRYSGPTFEISTDGECIAVPLDQIRDLLAEADAADDPHAPRCAECHAGRPLLGGVHMDMDGGGPAVRCTQEPTR